MERFLRIAAQILGKSTPARDENKNKTKTHKKKTHWRSNHSKPGLEINFFPGAELPLGPKF